MAHLPSVIVASIILGASYVLVHLHIAVAGGGAAERVGLVYVVNTITGEVTKSCIANNCMKPDDR